MKRLEKIKCLLLLTIFIPILLLRAEDQLHYELTVEGKTLSESFSQEFKSVQVITRRELEKLPVRDLVGVLGYVCGLLVKGRSFSDVQADLSIRGSSFEQVLIMVDGFPLKDAQTGHHLTQIPLVFAMVEKIEVLRGAAARIYGGNAYAGVINIVTTQKKEKSICGTFSVGNYNSFNLDGRIAIDALHSDFGLAVKKSGGYYYNSDYQQKTFSWKFDFAGQKESLKAFAGFLDKDFGANGFYSDRFPDQRERIKNFSSGVFYQRKFERLELSARFNFRCNRDNFWLNFKQPAFYFNQHDNYYFNLLSTMRFSGKYGLTTVALEAESDSIRGNRLGNRQRVSWGLIFDQKSDISSIFSVSYGFSLYRYRQERLQLFPGIDLLLNLKGVALFFSANRSFRLPTYTELYYQDPLHLANQNLQPEKSFELEGGLKLNRKHFNLQTTLFYRYNYSLIDWFWDDQKNLWQTDNLKSIAQIGLESDLTLDLTGMLDSSFFSGLRIAVAFLDGNQNDPLRRAKYSNNYLQRQFIFSLLLRPIKRLFFNLTLRDWKESFGQKVTLLDMRATFRLKGIVLNVDGTNLSDRFYYGAGKTPGMPRGFSAGVELSL